MIRPDTAAPLPPLASTLPPADPPVARAGGRVTLKDVAKVAGVHFTTVSMALRGHASIPEHTREHIRSVAERMGYTPNPIFQALTHFHLHGRVRAKAPEIAYVINVSRPDGQVRFPHERCILEGAQEQAAKLGYQLRFIAISRGQTDPLSVRALLEENQIRGLILASLEPQEPVVDLPWHEYAVVKVNSLHASPAATMVSNDQRQDVRLAFQNLLSRGYRRIGLAVGRADEEGTEFRYSTGALVEQSALPAEDRVPSLLFPHGASHAEIADLLRDWVRRHRVEAVLCNWTTIDELLRQGGLSVPRDVACASLCLIDAPQHGDTLAGVCPNFHLVGANAVSLLTTLIKAGEFGVPDFAPRTYVRSFWKDGTSAPTVR